MAQFIVNIPAESVDRVVNAFAASYDYPETVNGAPNPETKVQFARRTLKEYVSQVVASHEARQAADTARQDSLDSASTSLVIT